MSAATITWTKGGEASVVALEGDRITVRSSIPSAPGSRPEASLASGATFKIKVARCRKDEDVFVIEGRLIDTVRATRVELEGLAPR